MTALCIKCGKKVHLSDGFGGDGYEVMWGLCRHCDGYGFVFEGDDEIKQWWEAEGAAELAEDVRLAREPVDDDD